MPMFCWSLWKRGTKVALDERQVFVMLLIDEVYLLKCYASDEKGIFSCLSKL